LEHLGFTYRSLDIVQNLAQGVDYVQDFGQQVVEVPEGPRAFDLILCTEVLEHVPRWDIPFTNFANLLSEEGAVILTCPHVYIPHEEPFDYWRPTPNAVQFYARLAGLRAVSLERAGTLWDILGTLLSVATVQPATPRIADRLVARVLRTLVHALAQALVAKHPQGHVHLDSPFYVSTIAVLERDRYQALRDEPQSRTVP
jgi:SAM-dependent methyltransferase